MVVASEFDLNQRIIRDITREHQSNFLSADFIL